MQTERHGSPPEGSCSLDTSTTPPAAPRKHRPRIESVRRRLRQSADRLVKLLDMQAPEPVIASEITLLLRHGLSTLPCFGDFVGRWMVQRSRVQSGLCAECGEQDLAWPDRELCAECAAREDAEGDAAEQAVQLFGPLGQEILACLEETVARRVREEEQWQAGGEAEVAS